MISAPHLTESARAFLDGRPVHVRASPRHGCCGGSASVPVAEPATLTSPDAPDALDTLDTVERFDVAGTRVYVDRALTGAHGSWSIDTDGFARWRRLVVLGVELGPG